MKVELWDINKVIPYERNPRRNEAAIEPVVRSIKTFGFRQPIVVDSKGVIIVGHTRLKAAQRLGLGQVPVHVADDMSKEQIRAYRIADNRLAETASWDVELLRGELAGLQGLIDLTLMGFSADELTALLAPSPTEGLTDPDSVPAPPAKATTKPGDIWSLGRHRLMCANSAEPKDLDALLAGAKIHLVNTDPPYNVKVEPRSNNAIAAGLSSFTSPAKKKKNQTLRAKDRPLINDLVTEQEFDRLLNAWFANIARVLEPGRGFYIWGGYANIANYPPVMRTCGLYFSQTIIWVKEHPVLTRKDFMGNHEWCFYGWTLGRDFKPQHKPAVYGWKEGAGHQFFGEANVTDVWSVKKVNPQSMVHLTEKPVELATRAMEYSSRPGENVLDLFGGSGSTLIGAEKTCRNAYLMELDPLYCDVIVERWEKFTGRKASRGTA